MKQRKRYVVLLSWNTTSTPKPYMYTDFLDVALNNLRDNERAHHIINGWVYDRVTKKRIGAIRKGF